MPSDQRSGAEPAAAHRVSALIRAAADLPKHRDSKTNVGLGLLPRPFKLLCWLVLLAAALKVAVALVMAGLDLALPAGSAAPPLGFGYIVLQLSAFGIVGGVLLLAHAGDDRTLSLGAILLTIASAFSNSLLGQAIAFLPQLRWLKPIYPDALLPVLVFWFFAVFPRPLGQGRVAQWLRIGLLTSGVVGSALLVANLALVWLPELPAPLRPTLRVLSRQPTTGTWYWTLVFSLTVTAVFLGVVRTVLAGKDDQSRAYWLLAAFTLGLSPMAISNVAEAVPSIGQYVTSPQTIKWFEPLLQWTLASMPLTVSYAVMVHRVLPLKLVVRNALGHFLTRWGLGAALITPFGLFLLHLHRFRDLTIATVFSQPRPLALLTTTLVMGVVLGYREALLRAVDRWFFRELNDDQHVLADLVDHCRQVRSLDELVAVTTAGIDRALRPEAVSVLIRDATGNQLGSLFGTAESLSTSSVLADALEKWHEPLDVDLRDPQSPLRHLPRQERHWLVDTQSRLLVPLHSSHNQLMGVLVLGAKKNELPFTREDRRVLKAIGHACTLTIENHAFRASLNGDERWDFRVAQVSPRAGECEGCGAVSPATEARCARCGGRIVPGEIPVVLSKKFRLEERIGRGGMGVVYRATDLTLDRVVAIKMLPGSSPEQTDRLRAEARAMAALSHRHLAVVFAAESWHGKPLLVCEYMPRGTLADRLIAGRLDVKEVVRLGVVLADVVHIIHKARFLHRDLKPSNIGFDAEGAPKILDFGLVHILSESDVARLLLETGRTIDAVDDLSGLSSFSSGTSRLIGTPLYMSPEAIRGDGPTPSFDLWSLNVLLLEAVLGHHPFRGRDLATSLQRIRRAQLKDELEGVEVDALRRYFERALARDAGERPKSAIEIREVLSKMLEAAPE